MTDNSVLHRMSGTSHATSQWDQRKVNLGNLTKPDHGSLNYLFRVTVSVALDSTLQGPQCRDQPQIKA